MTPCGVCGAALETCGVIERDANKPRCPNCLRPELPLAGLMRERIQLDRTEDERDAAHERVAQSDRIAELERRHRELMQSRERRQLDPSLAQRFAELRQRHDERERRIDAIADAAERIAEREVIRARHLADRQRRHEQRQRQQAQTIWLAYGWNRPLGGNGVEHWGMSPSGVFRPLVLWVWEPSEWGVLTGVTVNGFECLSIDRPLRQCIAPVRLSAYWDEAHESRDVPRFTCHRELGRSVRAVLETRETPRRLDCPTLQPGSTLELRFRGSVRALALCGQGYAEETGSPSGRWRAQPAPPARATPAKDGG